MTIHRRKPAKFTATGKITLTAVSLIGFIGGWNLIAQAENQPAQANEPAFEPTVHPVIISATATPWPTIAPLAQLPPIPTLAAGASIQAAQSTLAANPVASVELVPLQLAPLPTLAPLPAQAAPPPPIPVQPAGNWNSSGGS